MGDVALRHTALVNAALCGAVAGSVYRSVRTMHMASTIVPLHEATVPPRVPATITVVIPARNEEAVLNECLRGIRTQTYGAIRRVIVVDDGSTDATSDIARSHAARDDRVKVISVDGPPSGWTGKVHAMHVGVEAAGGPEPGEWLLFVDADTVLSPQAVTRLLATAEAVDGDLVSTPGGPPPQRSASWSLLMPQGLQMIGENASPDGRGRKAFAIGHCIMLRRTHYEKIGGWSALSERRNEDVALATRVRDHGGVTRVVDALDHVTTSGMDPFSQGWASFRKSFVAGTGASVPILVGGGLGQIALSLAAPATLAVGVRKQCSALMTVGAVGWAAQSAAHTKTAGLMRANRWLAPAAPVTGALFGGVLLDGAVRVVRGVTAWKGRRTSL